MRILVTGITGFAGSFLAEHLLESSNDEIFGTCLSKDNAANVIKNLSQIHLEVCDLSKKENVFSLINLVKPDKIYHLAALASAGDSFKDPLKTIINNISIQVHLFEAIKDLKLFDTQILITSSAEIYGTADQKDLPMNEQLTLKPDNPYAVSKATQDLLGQQYFLSFGLKIIRIRPFNHIGPRQNENFAVASFAKRIAQIEKGIEEPTIYVGNLDSKRDFTDVRDMVKAYKLILEKGKSGDVYNIGSGTSHSMKEILDTLLSFSNKKIKIEIDKSRFRPSDIKELLCDGTKMQRLTDWKPMISLEKTLQDTLDYWRSLV